MKFRFYRGCGFFQTPNGITIPLTDECNNAFKTLPIIILNGETGNKDPDEDFVAVVVADGVTEQEIRAEENSLIRCQTKLFILNDGEWWIQDDFAGLANTTTHCLDTDDLSKYLNELYTDEWAKRHCPIADIWNALCKIKFDRVSTFKFVRYFKIVNATKGPEVRGIKKVPSRMK